MAGGDLTSFDESWQIALYVADRSTNNRGTIEPEVYADLALHWNPKSRCATARAISTECSAKLKVASRTSAPATDGGRGTGANGASPRRRMRVCGCTRCHLSGSELK